MEPEHLRFGGGASETQVHPLVLVWMLVAIVLILTLPRWKAITPLLLTFFTVPIGQVVVLGSLHFTVMRILILVGLARMISFGGSSKDKFGGGFNGVDWMVALWTVTAMVMVSLQWMEMQAVIHNIGDFLDALGGYLVIRFLIPDGLAVRRTIKTLAVICAINGVCMINEKISHINVFGLLGGIPLAVTVRDGHIRSGGVLGCLYAGAFAGVLIPLFLWMWTDGKDKMIAFVGIAGATAMVITSYSSTSWMAYGGSLIGLCFWPLRKWMRPIRWALVITIVGLHLAMKAPVWALIARIDLTGSSSGDHRYHLVDACIRHFGDWWLMGYYYYNQWGWDMWDLANQFVAVALTGGLLSLICYVGIFSRSFSAIGRVRKQVSGDRAQEWRLWCLGSALFATVVTSFGINYMAQLLMGFFPLLACISVATFEARQTVVQEAEIPSDSRLPSFPTKPKLGFPIGQPISRVQPR